MSCMHECKTELNYYINLPREKEVHKITTRVSLCVFLFNWYLSQKLSDCHICWDTKLGHGQSRAYNKTAVALFERTLLETPGPSTDHDLTHIFYHIIMSSYHYLICDISYHHLTHISVHTYI